MLFTSVGIPCSHIIAVMKYEHLTEISQSCIMQRWLKTDAYLLQEIPTQTIPNSETQTVRRGILKATCDEITHYASLTNEGWLECRPALDVLNARKKELYVS